MQNQQFSDDEDDLSDILEAASPTRQNNRRGRDLPSDPESETSSTTSSSSSSQAASATFTTNTATNTNRDGFDRNGSDSTTSETLSVTEEEFEFCLWKVKSRQDLEFTASARSAFLNSWMESSDFWIERLDKKQLSFLTKLLDI